MQRLKTLQKLVLKKETRTRTRYLRATATREKAPSVRCRRPLCRALIWWGKRSREQATGYQLTGDGECSTAPMANSAARCASVTPVRPVISSPW